MLLDELVAAARAWLADDPDPTTRAATEAMLAKGDAAALREAFGTRLEFGTAGIRGVLGPGPGNMNRALVRKVTAGLAAYLDATEPDARARGVVVGCDGRRLSPELTEDTCGVLAAAGFTVYRHPGVVPTPVLAHSVNALGTAAGVMVTASHNPPEYNGYKAYWSNGAQIVPPHDEGISAAIDAVQGRPAVDPAGVRPVPTEVTDAYLREVQALRVRPAGGVRVAYTALHGVGSAWVRRALREAGHTDLHEVAAQAEPDGEFPTVRFPNPEEPGAMDLVVALGREVGADVVLANDPDADRLCVAVPIGDGFRKLTGNDVGCLLADYLLSHGTGAERLVASSIVSSPLLARIAAEHGVDCATTLTGFKWIADAAMRWEARHPRGRFVLGYEEALGYSVGPLVRDKDGVSAALLFADLVAGCKADGRTVLDALADLHHRHGAWSSAQRSLVLPGSAGAVRIGEIMDELRTDPPTSAAGTAIVAVSDLLSGTRRTASGVAPLDGPRGDVLAFDLADGTRVLARPSGTEPKIKFYVDLCQDVAGLDEQTLRSGARARIAAILDDLVPTA